MPEMVNAYIRYYVEHEMPARPRDTPQPGPPTVDEVYEITVVDMFDTSEVDVKLDPRGDGVAPALILEGLVPCAPYKPDVAIAVRVLEAFRVLHARAPQLAIQPYVPFRPYLSQQFSIAYDRVMNALGRDSKWRLKHACPACMYKLEGEDELIFDMLTTMDGNDSLKRVLRRLPSDGEGDGEPTLGRSKERVDNRDAGDGYYLSRERVDAWAKTRLAEILPMEAHSGEDNPCADRWKNMVNDVTSKMWGIFDERGVFLALCRHVRKYPLAVVQELLDVFGMKLGAGYDIGCHFDATVRYSQLGDQARANKLKCLVGLFHGHAHNRLCQLSFLATYVEGMGLEDLEGCERFHRQQEITTYAKHFDSFETYANLSKFLCTNYRQCPHHPQDRASAADWMRQEHVESFDEFHQWLLEEKGQNTPWSRSRRGAELARRHAKEKVEKDLESVHALEVQLDVTERWTVVEIKKRKYQLALDALELLIVERIFELTKMNQCGKHIAKALQARSKAVKNAIGNYKHRRWLAGPAMPHLSWEQVVEYAFLADFDILRDTRTEVQSRPWTRPAYRLAMDRYFKILRAREEIKRLNVEIPPRGDLDSR
ncbi:hypothetical protein B0H14DRAFT_3098641 [Mycena olivaceomarginata]|nr:hypothetical protein B0H14DRAFT_3098641 [Mycena olivaceomarginata]